MKVPPTRNHRQLAKWINAKRLYNCVGQRVCARVSASRVNTDRKIGRLRWPGKGRASLRLEIWIDGSSTWDPSNKLYEHESGETYRRHSEAREWVSKNLRRAARRHR